MLGAGLLGLLVALAFNATATKIYMATSQSFVAVADSGNTAGGILSGANFTLQRVKSYTTIVDSPDVLQPAIDELGLDVTVTELGKRVSATSPLDTVLIEVSAQSTSPQEAADIANAVARQLGTVIDRLEKPLTGAASPVKVSLITPATPPASPSSPRTLINLGLGLLLGLAAGAAWALWRSSTDTRIVGATQVTELQGSAPLGLIPFDASAGTAPLLSAESTSPRAEAYRAVRTNLRFVDVDNPPRVLAVTSAIPGEGKSTTACNLAIALAEAGESVVIVESDLRRGRLADYLQIDGGVGLTSVLSGQTELDAALLPWRRGLLSVLAGGPKVPNPSELLGSKQMHDLVAELSGRFDKVVIDAAPLLPVTDGAVAAAVADGALVVVRHGHTTEEQLEQALQALELGGAHVIGTIVNFVPEDKRSRGYGYGYGYGSTAAPASP